MYISHEDARVHNIIQRIFIKKLFDDINNGIEEIRLKDELNLREEDIGFLKSKKILEKDEKQDKFYPTQKLIKEIQKIKDKKLNDPPEKVNKLKEEFKQEFDNLKNTKTYVNAKAIELATEIHWNMLPEYEEYIIVNSEIYPNEDTEEYYNCYHTLEDLYNAINGNGKDINSKKGDVNINHRMQIKIYTRRWGHYDSYTIIRTIKGWDVEFHQTFEGGKEGDALIKFLKHDFVNYPSELGTFMMHLWNRADRDEMEVEELESHLENIANWINMCEINTPEGIEE